MSGGLANSTDVLLLNLRKCILGGYIVDISPCLPPSDLITCARGAREAGLIPQRILDDLLMVDLSIPHETRCRYLMLYIGKTVIANEKLGQANKFHGMIQHLLKFLNIKEIKNCLIKSVDKLDGEVKPAEVFEIKPEVVMNVELHLHRLYEILSDYRHLWDKIGLTLQFSYDDLKNINSDCNRDTALCLHKLLHTWLSLEHPGVKPPTIGALEEVLNSKLVGLRGIVENIKENLQNTTTLGMDKYNIHMDDNILTYSSCDVTVRESSNDIVVLIEVRVKCQDPISIKYEWIKDGKALKSSDSLILGNSILCIRVTNICVEGKYLCVCKIGKEIIKSNPIEVKVETSVCKYRQRLITRYNIEPEVKQDTWHKVQQNTYINLAVIGGEGVRLSDKCFQQTIRGDADDVFNSKASIEYQEAFRDIEYGDRVFVVGRPGSGKTTLVHKVSKDWAKGLVLGKYKLLFLVYLRGFHNNPDVSLQNLVKCYFKKQKDVDRICEYIEECEGLGMCFILDGLDEYQPEKEACNFIFKLVEGEELRCATIIVASRPAAVAIFDKVCRRQVEVLGFFKEQIEEYIKFYEFSSDSQRSNLMEYLSHRPNIHHMCYLPIQSAMICFLFDECVGTLSNTETDIYVEFTKHTLLRALHRTKHSNYELHSLEDLEDTEMSVLLDVCKLAYEMTISSIQVIQKEKAELFFTSKKIEKSLGLITVDEKATNCGFQNLYSFFHLTFQEFLAAYHISRLEVQEQLSTIRSYSPKKHMYMVFKFYCGLAQFKENDIKFKTLVDVAKFSTAHKIQCCFESQQPDTCDLIAEKNIIHIKDDFTTPSDYTGLGYVVTNASYNPVSIIEYYVRTALSSECIEAYINSIKAVEKVPIWVSIGDSDFDEDMMEVKLCPCLMRQGYSEECSAPFNFVSCNFQASHSDKNYSNLFYSTHCNEVSSHINGIIKRAETIVISYALKCELTCYHCPFDEHDICLCTDLIIFNCGLNNDGASLLAEGLRYNSRVEVLKLVANDIGDEGALAIAVSIKGCSSLCSLDLSLNKIGDHGATSLMNSVRSNFSLFLFGNHISVSLLAQPEIGNSEELFHTLNIHDDIGNRGLAQVNSLMEDLSMSHSILDTQQTLYLESCGNDVDGIKEAANIWSRFTCLYSLSLIGINMGAESVKLLINTLQWEHVHILNLSHNSIRHEGMTQLCQTLQGISHQILALNLGHNNIGVEGALSLAKCLQVSQSLLELDLSYNDIQDTGTEAICKSLKNVDKLQVLNLASNSIGPLGYFSIAILLEQNSKSLIALDLSSNNLSDLGIIRLARSLRYCFSLQKLHLNDNHIGHIGIEAIAEVLMKTDLIELSLEDNFINNRGAKVLACCLQYCCKLTTLSLSNNVIADVGASCLGTGLSHCSRLHTLELNCNSILGSGAISLAGGIRHCHDLNTLELGDNYLEDSDLQLLAMTLKDCKELKYLYVPTKLLLPYKCPLIKRIYDFIKYLPNCTVYGTVDREKKRQKILKK